MAITQDQKADIGTRYIDNIKERLETRKLAQKRAHEASKVLNNTSPMLKGYAKDLAKKHNMDGALISISAEESYNTALGKRVPVLELNFTHGYSLSVPVAFLSEYSAAKTICDAQEELSHELCQEISFLSEMLAPGKVSLFIQHTCRIWSPPSKDVVVSDKDLKGFIDDFLVPARPAVCKA